MGGADLWDKTVSCGHLDGEGMDSLVDSSPEMTSVR